MLTIQNASPAFQGKFVRSEILEKRINELRSPAKLEMLNESLKQMDAKKDGKIYHYIEEKVEKDNFFDVVENTVAYITNEKGEKLKEMLMSGKCIYNNARPDFRSPKSSKSISDFISDFANEHYPKKTNHEDVRKNIFNLLG